MINLALAEFLNSLVYQVSWSLISQNCSTGAYMGGAYKTILRVPFLTFNVSNSNFLNGGGSDVEVEMRSLITDISFSVVQERSTACNGKKRKFRCSNDLIRRIDKVTSD